MACCCEGCVASPRGVELLPHSEVEVEVVEGGRRYSEVLLGWAVATPPPAVHAAVAAAAGAGAGHRDGEMYTQRGSQ